MSGLRMTEEQVAAHRRRIGVAPLLSAAAGGGNKYRARKVFEDGRVFGSKKEHRRYLDLVARERAGEITGLRCHVAFALFDPGDNCRGELIGRYTCDFVYKENGKLTVEDVKGRHTAKLRDWPRTKKLLFMCHGIEVVEIL